VVHAFQPDDQEAGERVARLQRETRSRADGHLRAGKAHHREGRYATARAQFLAALAWDPDLAEAAEYLRHRMGREDLRTYVTQVGDTPESVAQEVYADPRKHFLVSYFTGLSAGAVFPSGTTLRLPVVDIPVAGGPRVPARANAPVPSYGLARDTAPAPSVAPPPAQPPLAATTPDGTLDRAQASLRAGEYTKAAALAEAVLARSPGHREARELRNAAYYQLGTDALRRQEYSDALRMLRKVDASYKDQKQLLARADSRVREEAEKRYAAGLKCFLAEDLDGAVQQWETTLALSPEHPKAKRDLDRARRLLEQVKSMQ
jgi:tetratricopeptide (TPR) repeat protein